jgi:poly(3-hydroxyoctanoate) depolymerase
MSDSPGAANEAGLEVGHVDIRGLKLRYAQSAGTGEPLLICNGIGANLELVLPLVRALAGVRVVLFDLPGTGGSEPACFWPSFSRYGGYATAMLDALGHRGGFTVAGASWGGALAQQIAHDCPERVRGLILMATSPGITMIPGRLSSLIRMATPQRYLSRTFMEQHAAEIYGGEMRGRPDLAARFARMTRAPSRPAYLQQLLAGLQFSSLCLLHRIRCPALILSGDDDPIVRPINARILAALLPNARLHIVAGGGHLFMVLRPEQTAGIVLEFMRQEIPSSVG